MPKEIPRMGGVWGYRGILGYISPTVFGSQPDQNLYEVVPEGVGILVTGMGINRVDDDNLEEALTRVDDAARKLAEAGADYIFLSGAFGLVTRPGVDRNMEIVKRLEEVSKVPSMVLHLGVVNALNALSVKKLIWVHVGSPIENVDSRGKKMWESYGFEVINIKTPDVEKLGLWSNKEVRKIPMSVPYNLAREAYLETPQADGIYIDCGAWGGLPVVECLEQDFGKPVIIPNSAFLWGGLKVLKLRPPVKGFGRLFETLL